MENFIDTQKYSEVLYYKWENGKFISHERGFGFVKVEGEDFHIFISPKDTKGAMNDDIVSIKVLNKKHGQHKEGQVIKIIKAGLIGYGLHLQILLVLIISD
jgi:exoribonuclease R